MLVTVDSSKASDILTGPIIDLVTSDALQAIYDVLYEEFVEREHLDNDTNNEFYEYEYPTSMDICFLDLIPVPNIIVDTLNDRVRITKSINELMSLYCTLDYGFKETVEQVTDSVDICLSDGGYDNGDIIRSQICGKDKSIISDMVKQFLRYCVSMNLKYSTPLTHFNGKLAVVVG